MPAVAGVRAATGFLICQAELAEGAGLSVPVADVGPEAEGEFEAADGVWQLPPIAVGGTEVVQRPCLAVAVTDVAANDRRLL
jgi:hypothetical protein